MKRTFAFSMILASSTFFATPQIAKAACDANRPDCNTLGYTQSSTDCSGKATLPCPFDPDKKFCGDVVSSCSYTYTAANGGYGPSCKNSSGTTVYQNKCTGVAESNCSNTFAATCISGNGTRYGLCVEAGGGDSGGGSTCSCPNAGTVSNISTWCDMTGGYGDADVTTYFCGDVNANTTHCIMNPDASWAGCNETTAHIHLASLETPDNADRIMIEKNVRITTTDLTLSAPATFNTDYLDVTGTTTFSGESIKNNAQSTNNYIYMGPEHSDGSMAKINLGTITSEDNNKRMMAVIKLNTYAHLTIGAYAKNPAHPILCVEHDDGTTSVVSYNSQTFSASPMSGSGSSCYDVTMFETGYTGMYNGQVCFNSCQFIAGLFICSPSNGGCRALMEQLKLETGG